MNINIIGEDFSLTDAIKDQVEEKVNKIKEHMKNPSPFTVFLKKENAHLYEVKFQTHYDGHDCVGQASGREFYTVLNDAKKSILRQIDDLHAKKVRDRRHS